MQPQHSLDFILTGDFMSVILVGKATEGGSYEPEKID